MKNKIKLRKDRYLRTFLFVLLFTQVVPACVRAEARRALPARGAGPSAARGAVSVPDPGCDPSRKRQRITFVHVGDMHANFGFPADKYSRIRAYYLATRKENPYTFFTNAGDDHEKGSLAEPLTHGQAVSEVTPAMDFDVRTLGNHDFAWGEKHLLDFSRDSRALVLASNTRYLGDNAKAFGGKEFGILKAGCLRVGFFGMLSPPWNELDENYNDEYFPAFQTSYAYEYVARKIVETYRGEVDLLVMVSHLKYIDDLALAQAVPGIDLVLGGHSHTGAQAQKVGNTLVVQPNYFADGVTRVDLDVDLASRKILSVKRKEKTVASLGEIDPAMHQTIAAVLAKYAPDARKTVAYLDYARDAQGTAWIAAKAAMSVHKADAALLDPGRVYQYRLLPLGAVTPQDILDVYSSERQKPDTPGINSFYLAEVSGESLKTMRDRQNTWVYSGPAAPDPEGLYRLILQKGPALDPGVFFPDTVSLQNVKFLSEAWETLTADAEGRTAACLHLDTSRPLSGCRKKEE